MVTAKIIFDDLGNFSLSGRGASEKPSVEQNNDCFLKWLGRGIGNTGNNYNRWTVALGDVKMEA